MIFTNATLIDEKMAKDIAYLQPLSVETTIFSPSADVHDRITKLKGSLNKTLNGVKLLK